MMRTDPNISLELPLWQSGHLAAGLDEAGRGAWAGPVSAAAVILPPDPAIQHRLKGVRDSKQMTPRQRYHWAAIVKQEVLAWGIGFCSNEEIDVIGIVQATRVAMARALHELSTAPHHLLIDALRLPDVPLPQTSLFHGDNLCLSIAAASVLAKTERDTRMVELSLSHPGYGLEKHKGYGTAFHCQALQRFGLSTLHRRSFAPCNSFVFQSDEELINLL